MKKLISPKYIILYLILSIGFYFAFESISHIYLKDRTLTPHAIDIHLKKTRCFFDDGYIVKAKHGGYDIAGYSRSFFLLDLVFPVVYTFLFLSILAWHHDSKFYRYLFALTMGGAVFDYLENFSFFIFLNLPDDGLAYSVAFFSTIKSILFGINLIIAAWLLIRKLVGLL